MSKVLNRPALQATQTYLFRVIIEPDHYADGTPAWMAYCPDLKGTTTFGQTQEEAFHNVREVIQMALETMQEDGKPIPIPPVAPAKLESQIIVTL